jgi:hypothetical protein
MAVRPGEHAVAPVDAFDLPEWLGEQQVTWVAESSLGTAHLVSGVLSGPDATRQECDLLACDLAYPRAVLGEEWRAQAHHAWQLGEALLIEYDGRLTLVVPGAAVAAEPALEAVRRLARAVGAPTERFTVALRL